MLFLVVFGGLLLLAQGVWSQDSPEQCVGVKCDYQDLNKRFCHVNKARFCQCGLDENGDWFLQVIACPYPDTFFSRSQQLCVHSSVWNPYECAIQIDPTPWPTPVPDYV
ncbi:hypothetical protein RP20_CCG027395 [Aedes albopictus]|nr:hypothetical protein RP20_CCG027395 [Aedes albopictus]